MWDNGGIKTNSTALTLKNIGGLIDQKLDQKLIPIFGEFDGLKQQISDVNDNLESKIAAHRKETEEGFDTVFDGLANLGTAVDKNI